MPIEPNPKTCMHRMVFAERFCICSRCQQTWELGEYGWNPIDPEYRYRARPKKKQYGYRGKKKSKPSKKKR